MKPLLPLLLIVLFACQKEVLPPTSINAQTSSDDRISGQQSFPLEFLIWDDCTNEWVLFSTVLEYKFNYFTNKTDFHANAHYQYKQGSGVGVTSGKYYKLIGQSVDVERFKDFATTQNESVRVTTKLRFATPGGGNDLVNESIRIRRILADGTVKVDVEDEKTYCK